MEATIFLSKALGLCLIVIGAAIIVRRHYFLPVFAAYADERLIRTVVSMIELAVGQQCLFTIAGGHHHAARLDGRDRSARYLFLPDVFVAKLIGTFNTTTWYIVGGLLAIGVGLYFAGFGFGVVKQARGLADNSASAVADHFAVICKRHDQSGTGGSSQDDCEDESLKEDAHQATLAEHETADRSRDDARSKTASRPPPPSSADVTPYPLNTSSPVATLRNAGYVAQRRRICEQQARLDHRADPCACLEASDGKAVLPIPTSNSPLDLLITDVGLPNMNGSCPPPRPDLKILFVTGYGEHATGHASFLARSRRWWPSRSRSMRSLSRSAACCENSREPRRQGAREIVDAVIAKPAGAPLNSVEGSVRQTLHGSGSCIDKIRLLPSPISKNGR